MTGIGLARLLRLLGQNRALALDEGRIETGDIDALRVGGGDMHRHLLAEALELGGVAGRFSATMTPILPRPGEIVLCM